jgi:hypothetical protein
MPKLIGTSPGYWKEVFRDIRNAPTITWDTETSVMKWMRESDTYVVPIEMVNRNGVWEKK